MTLAAGFYQFALSLAMIAAFVLVWSGSQLLWSGSDRLRGVLMIGVAAVLFVNVLIWAVPVR